jgi:hypothetical protein
MRKLISILALILMPEFGYPASFYIQSGNQATIATKTSAYTLTSSDEIILVDTNAVTLTLPTAVNIEGTVYTIKKINTEYDEALTIDPAGSETVDSQATYVIYDVNSGVSIVSNGTNWLIINKF